jgi:glycosyltransferase involved in cell wall biosynthesis
MAQMYKGFDVLLHALSMIRRSRPDVVLTIVGGGRYLESLVALAEDLGLAHAVTFTGAVTSAERIRELLDASDLYVSASRTEGLPRVVIEASARGLPAVGTNVGSTSELLPPEAMCQPGDAAALAELCASVMTRPALAGKLAGCCLLTSRAYAAPALQAHRDAMFTSLRERTREWQARLS